MHKTVPVLEVGEMDTLRGNSITWSPLGEAQMEDEPTSSGVRRGGQKKRDQLQNLLRCIV